MDPAAQVPRCSRYRFNIERSEHYKRWRETLLQAAREGAEAQAAQKAAAEERPTKKTKRAEAIVIDDEEESEFRRAGRLQGEWFRFMDHHFGARVRSLNPPR